MTTQASRFDLEHAIIDFCEGLPALKGAFMIAYIGKGIRLGDGSTHIIPSGVTLPETKFKLNDEDWEEAVRGMCLPVSWIEGQLAMVRGSDDRPGLILLDFSIGASPFAGRVPSAKPWKGPHIRSPNTGIITYDPLGAEVEVFRERQTKGLASGPVPAQPKVGGKTLVRTVLDLMMERGQVRKLTPSVCPFIDACVPVFLPKCSPASRCALPGARSLPAFLLCISACACGKCQIPRTSTTDQYCTASSSGHSQDACTRSSVDGGHPASRKRRLPTHMRLHIDV